MQEICPTLLPKRPQTGRLMENACLIAAVNGKIPVATHRPARRPEKQGGGGRSPIHPEKKWPPEGQKKGA